MSKTFSEGFGMSPTKAPKHESVMPMAYEKNIIKFLLNGPENVF